MYLKSALIYGYQGAAPQGIRQRQCISHIHQLRLMIQPRPLAPNRDELHRLIPDPWANLIKTYCSGEPGTINAPAATLLQFEQLKLMTTLIRNYDIEQVDVRKVWELKSQFTTIPSE